MCQLCNGFCCFFPVHFRIFSTHILVFIHLLLLLKCNRNSSKTNKIMLIYSKPPLFSPTDSPMQCNNWTLDSFAYGRWFLSWSTKCTPWLMCLTWWKWSHCEGVFNQESFIPRNVCGLFRITKTCNNSLNDVCMCVYVCM